jgi:hypothetical protein
VLSAQVAFFSAASIAALSERLFRFPESLTEFVQFGDLNKEIGRIIGEN